MSRAELSVLLALLPAYHRHVERHPHTLLSRFLGLHAVTTAGGKTVRGRWKEREGGRGHGCWQGAMAHVSPSYDLNL